MEIAKRISRKIKKGIIMSKQTAVEWLYKLSKERELDKFDLDQAKEMEKQQMKEGYLKGIENYDPTFKKTYEKL